MNADLKALIPATIFRPAEAAQSLLALRLPMQVGWMILVAAAAMNAFLVGLSTMLIALPEDAVPLFTLSPMMFFGLLILFLSATVLGITSVGRWMGGTGQFEQVLVLLGWLQVLRAIAQVGIMLIAFVLPFLADLAPTIGFVVSLWGLWIAANFVDQAHGFGSAFKAFGVMLIAAILVVMGVFFFIGLFIGPLPGVPNV